VIGSIAISLPRPLLKCHRSIYVFASINMMRFLVFIERWALEGLTAHGDNTAGSVQYLK